MTPKLKLPQCNEDTHYWLGEPAVGDPCLCGETRRGMSRFIPACFWPPTSPIRDRQFGAHITTEQRASFEAEVIECYPPLPNDGDDFNAAVRRWLR